MKRPVTIVGGPHSGVVVDIPEGNQLNHTCPDCTDNSAPEGTVDCVSMLIQRDPIGTYYAVWPGTLVKATS